MPTCDFYAVGEDSRGVVGFVLHLEAPRDSRLRPSQTNHDSEAAARRCRA